MSPQVGRLVSREDKSYFPRFGATLRSVQQGHTLLYLNHPELRRQAGERLLSGGSPTRFFRGERRDPVSPRSSQRNGVALFAVRRDLRPRAQEMEGSVFARSVVRAFTLSDDLI